MIYHSNYSDDYLWYLILHGKKLNSPEYKVPPRFQWLEQKCQGCKNVLEIQLRKWILILRVPSLIKLLIVPGFVWISFSEKVVNDKCFWKCKELELDVTFSEN